MPSKPSYPNSKTWQMRLWEESYLNSGEPLFAARRPFTAEAIAAARPFLRGLSYEA
jgi:hypothetical protein